MRTPDGWRSRSLVEELVWKRGICVVDTKPEGLDGEFARRVIKLMSRSTWPGLQAHPGPVGGTWRIGAGWKDPVPICLMEHRGRRTGKLRTTPARLPA